VGEAVVKACVEGGANYVDISGETEVPALPHSFVSFGLASSRAHSCVLSA
jgi:hypothetical protein